MKRRYDASVKPQTYSIGEKVLVYNPKKCRGQFSKWQPCWFGPFTVEKVLNSTNYVVKKGRGKSVVIHVDRMRKLPSELGSDNSDSEEDDMHCTSQPKQRRKASDAAIATSTHCTTTSGCPDADTGVPLFAPMDTDTMLFLPNDLINVGISDDPDTSDSPGNAYHSSPYLVAAVGGPGLAAQPIPRSARRRHCVVHRLGDLLASASLIGQHASKVVSRFAGSCMRRSRLPDECVIRRVIAVKKSDCCVVSSADSTSNFGSMLNKPISVLICRTLSRLIPTVPVRTGNVVFCLT